MASSQNNAMTTGSWLLTFIILSIPLVNFIMCIVWACGIGNRSRVTFCRASILSTIICIAIFICITFLVAIHPALLLTKLTTFITHFFK